MISSNYSRALTSSRQISIFCCLLAFDLVERRTSSGFLLGHFWRRIAGSFLCKAHFEFDMLLERDSLAGRRRIYCFGTPGQRRLMGERSRDWGQLVGIMFQLSYRYRHTLSKMNC